MGQIGLREILVLAVIILLVFGAKRLPDLARSLGRSARILKSEATAMKSDPATSPAAAAPASAPPASAPSAAERPAPAPSAPATPVAETTPAPAPRP